MQKAVRGSCGLAVYFLSSIRAHGWRATAGRSWLISTYRPACVMLNRTTLILRSPISRVLALAVASPQATRLSTISGVKPRARSTPSVIPRRSPALTSISSARRHSALSGILSIATGLTLVGDREPPQGCISNQNSVRKSNCNWQANSGRPNQIRKRVELHRNWLDACAHAPTSWARSPTLGGGNPPFVYLRGRETFSSSSRGTRYRSRACPTSALKEGLKLANSRFRLGASQRMAAGTVEQAAIVVVLREPQDAPLSRGAPQGSSPQTILCFSMR